MRAWVAYCTFKTPDRDARFHTVRHVLGTDLPFVRDPIVLVPICPGVRNPFVWDLNVLVPICPGPICPRIVQST